MSSTKNIVKPHILYNKPPNTQLLSSETPSCTIANSFMTQGMPPPPGMIPDNTSEEEPQSDKLGYWGYRHLYPFGYHYRNHFGMGYPYWTRGCYGYPCYRGYGGYGGYGGIYSFL